MIVYWQNGYLIDWDWAATLTVWTTGRDRAEQLVGHHRLDRVPDSSRKAVAAAQQWWQKTGRAKTAELRDQERPADVAL